MARNESVGLEPSASLRRRHERDRLSFILSRDAVREVDRAAIEDYGIAGIVLMENAARGLADAAIDMLERLPAVHVPDGVGGQRHVLIVCGGGNNGGDGYALARHLHNTGIAVTTMMLAEPKPGSDAAINRNVCLRMNIQEVSAALLDSVAELRNDVIVDAMFGTGLDRPISGTPRNVIEWINRQHSPVLAVDIPSGLDCDTGEIYGVCVKAVMTCTFVAMKPSFQQLDIQHWLGEVRVVDVGAPRELIEKHGERLPAPPPGLTDVRRAAHEVARARE